MLTPFVRPATPAQERYNTKHRKTRVLIEQVFGRWKRRFAILQTRVRVKYNRVPLLVTCCGILHNIAVKYRLPDIDDDDYVEIQDPHNNALRGRQEGQDGLNYRLIIAERF